jgi:arylsulfatase
MKDWFIRGYDDYMPPPGRSRSPGSVINGIGMPWITEHKEQDFFLFLHFWDAHIPYVPPSPYKERFTHGTSGRIDPNITAKLEGRPSYPLFKQNLYDFLDAMPNLEYIADLYDAEVAYLDFEIGRIFQHLESEGLLDDTMVVLFGDHGENMTEHDAWFDHAGLYDSVTHVPLLMWAPGRIPVCESDAMVTLTDVLPTILEALGMPEAEGIDGRSLFPLMRGETTTHRDAVMLSEATWQAARAVRTPEWKYIKFLQTSIYGRDGVELYDLTNDPHEQVNVADAHPEVVADLGSRLNHWVSAQLGGHPDPMHSVLDAGLPAVARLNDVIAGQSRPRNDVPTPTDPDHGLVLAGVSVAAAGPMAASDHLESGTTSAPPSIGTSTGPPTAPPGDGGKFAPANPHKRRLRGARGVVVGTMVLASAVLLATAVNGLLLTSQLSATGVVQPTLDAQLNMPATGPITSLTAHVGEAVHTGQVLASQDTSALGARLTADESKLVADQATLAAQQAGGQPTQVQQLQDQLVAARTALSSAQQKLTGTQSTTGAATTSAAAQVSTEQALLTSDQQTYQDNIPSCTSATPPLYCASDQRQVQVDQGILTADRNALAVAVAGQESQITGAQNAVNQAAAAVNTALSALAAGSAPATPQAIASTQATIQLDQAAIVADQAKLTQAVVVAPFDGVVSSVNGSVGEVVSSQGVKQATAPAALSQGQTTGIQLFPQGPQTGSGGSSPAFAALITLDSVQNQMVVQIPETSINDVHVGQKAKATLPAMPGTTLAVVVSRIERTPVTSSGQTYFRVDLVTTAKGPHTLSYDAKDLSSSSLASIPTPGQLAGFTVDVSF